MTTYTKGSVVHPTYKVPSTFRQGKLGVCVISSVQFYGLLVQFIDFDF